MDEPPTVARAARLVRTREATPAELARAALERVARLDGALNAFLLVTPDTAMAQAEAAPRDGALAGVPHALKDIIGTKGIRTTGHSRVCLDNVPTEDAACVTRLRGAGAVLLGKLATHEFAHGGPSFDLPFPPARNPWDTGRITGGSSSGSAAAVAAGLVPFALGTDTGGSIRGPAALCGVAGLKPTYGLVSRRGVMPNSFSLDHVGPLAWTVEDCALVLGALAGHDPLDPGSADRPPVDYAGALREELRGLRIGVVRHFHETDLECQPAAVLAFEAALDVLRGLGAALREVRLRPLKQYSDVKVAIAESELFSVHAAALRERPGDFGEDFLGRALGATLLTGADYVDASRERRAMMAEADELWRGVDAVVTLAAPGEAPPFGAWRTEDFWRRPNLTSPFNVLGGPALALCMGFGPAGLPLSLQVAGPAFADATVLAIGHAFERATPWRDRRPAPATAPPPPLPPVPDPPAPEPALRARVAEACRAAGLRLDERQLDVACISAPWVAALQGRLRRTRGLGDEPASIFRA